MFTLDGNGHFLNEARPLRRKCVDTNNMFYVTQNRYSSKYNYEKFYTYKQAYQDVFI